MYRVEDKYACSEMEMRIIQARIAAVLKPDQNQKSDVGYRVTSVYFDDLFDTHLQDTIDGYARREKYRIRIYNNLMDSIKLEVKYKQYNRVMKKSERISAAQMQMLLEGKCIPNVSDSEDSPAALFNLAISNRGLRPKVIVEYDRQAYVFDPGNVRITFDRNIRASDQIERFGKASCCFAAVHEQDRVLEVKYDEFFPDFIAQLLETGNMIQTSYSKYQLCRERIGE